MKVSIITVVYNNKKTIENAINSVLNQSFKNIEYIIIDGKSTDGTLKIIESYKDRISYIISEPDKGIYDAMNKGIKLASGDIIGMLNSDDLYFDNNVVADVVSCFSNDPQLDTVYADLEYVKKDNTEKIVRLWRSNKYYTNYFEHGYVPAHPTLFVKKHVYDNAGIFDLEFKLAADYEFMLRIFKKHNFKSAYINRVMVKMRLGGATSKNVQNRLSQNIEILNAWKVNGLVPPPFFMFFRILNKLKQFFAK